MLVKVSDYFYNKCDADYEANGEAYINTNHIVHIIENKHIESEIGYYWIYMLDNKYDFNIISDKEGFLLIQEAMNN